MKTEKATRRSEQKLKLVSEDRGKYEILFENASDAILVVDLKSARFIDANLAALELTGYLRDELLDLSVDALVPTSAGGMGQSPPLGRQQLEANGFFEDVVLRSRDAIPRFVSLSVRTLELEGRRVAMCILRDVGEKKRMERDLITKHTELRSAFLSLEKANLELKAMQETLVQSGKLAALGELAAGIAHELNQPLTVVKGFAQECRADGTLSSATRANIDEIVRAADKMGKIIGHLRNFTRKSTEDFTLVNVHSVIDESLVMLGSQLGSRGIQVERSFEQDLPQVYCNPFQLEQVFINLATNARDAIDAKKERAGKIHIHTRRAADGMIEVVYEDNGSGIPEAVRSKIFNPFFTTKEVGKGMGLGLSISYGILSRINASIVVESTPGKGTRFTIRLPEDYRKH